MDEIVSQETCTSCGDTFGNKHVSVYAEGKFHFFCTPDKRGCAKCKKSATHLQGFFFSDSVSIMLCNECYKKLRNFLNTI